MANRALVGDPGRMDNALCFWVYAMIRPVLMLFAVWVFMDFTRAAQVGPFLTEKECNTVRSQMAAWVGTKSVSSCWQIVDLPAAEPTP